MKSILVPIDFSKCSIDALRFASLTAKKANAKIHLLHIIQQPNYYFMGSDPLIVPPNVIGDKYNENLKKGIKKTLNKLQRAFYLKNITVKSKIETGVNIYKSILIYAQKEKIDIIIMGSQGSNSIKEILLGSNAERVVRFSNLPVLVVPHKIHRLKTIVFASDFKEEAYRVFPVVQKFAKLFDAEINLIKINTYDQFKRITDNMDLLRTFNKKFGTNHKMVIYDDYMKEEGILHYSDEIDADLIAIGTHGKKGLARFFRGDVSGVMVRLTQRPILVVNFSDRK